MGLAELSDMVRRGEISHREANELDGCHDDCKKCCSCEEKLYEDCFSECQECGYYVCDDCKIVDEDLIFCCDECKSDYYDDFGGDE